MAKTYKFSMTFNQTYNTAHVINQDEFCGRDTKREITNTGGVKLTMDVAQACQARSIITKHLDNGDIYRWNGLSGENSARQIVKKLDKLITRF